VTTTTIEAQTTEAALRAENYRLREALKPPEGFASWPEALLAERLARVRAEQALAAAQESFATGDSWVLRDFAVQCAQRAAAQNNPFDTREDAQPFEPARWVLEAMRAAIRWDRKMNRDEQPADTTKGPG
jgi:hypothetical protein